MTEIERYVQQIFEEMNISRIFAGLAEMPRLIEEAVGNLQNEAREWQICICKNMCTCSSH